MGAEDPFATQPTDYKPELRGRYVFRRPLAAGGLGVVSIYYDAELNREVALKEIRSECADDPRHRRNFCAEAEVTGSLEHPGIVPIYSMGNNVDGRPFYAMRFISGDELRDHIVRFHQAVKAGQESFTGPRLRQLLQRLIDVCNVIHYAHARGVLHRDLKSINVMLGRYGETLVIDWGLAKTTGTCEVHLPAKNEAVDRPPQERPVLVSGSNLRDTQAGTSMGTIAYAPPEQLTGQTDEIDARSDVYSIGAMLYEVLTGDPPCKGMGITQAIKEIELGKIVPPSEVLSETPRPLSAIACKAIAASKQLRYQSAEELKNDLQRWLDDEPVSAYRETRRERIYRWKRKHETFVRWATASLAIVTLISFFAVYRINTARKQQQQARTEATKLYQLARMATDNLLTRTSDRLSEIPDATDVQQALLKDAMESYRQMADVRSDDPELRRESARVAIGLADVLRQLDEKNEAIAALQTARETLKSLSSDEDQILLARTFIEESRIHGKDDQRDIDAADAAISKSLPITERLTSREVPSNEALLTRGKAMIQRGVVASDQQDYARAVESFASAATTLQRLRDREIDDDSLKREVRLQLTRAYNNEAMRRKADDPLVIERYRSAMDQANWLTEHFPDDPSVIKEHANVLNNFGGYLLEDIRDLDKAQTLYQQSVDYFADLSAKKPTIAQYKELWILALVGLGNVASDRGDRDAMVTHYSKAVEVSDQLLAQNRNRIGFLTSAAQAKTMLGVALMDDAPERAEAYFADVINLLPKSDPEGVREFAEGYQLELYNRTLQANSEPGLNSRLGSYIRSTAPLKSANSNFNVACSISKSCQTLLDNSGDRADVDRYLNVAIERLRSAIAQQPELWPHVLTDDDLSQLRELRSDAIDSMNPDR